MDACQRLPHAIPVQRRLAADKQSINGALQQHPARVQGVAFISAAKALRHRLIRSFCPYGRSA